MIALRDYILNNRVDRKRLEAEVRDDYLNPYPKRDLFATLTEYASDFIAQKAEPRLIAISGLRGVGKSTLMWQAAADIFERGVKDLFFLDGNDLKSLGYTLHEAFHTLQGEVLGKRFYECTETILFLIDEVQELENWDRDLKTLYDRCKQAFILCTGSSALLLHNSPNLASRMTSIRLFPFRFTEFIHATTWIKDKRKGLLPIPGLDERLEKILFFSEDSAQLWDGIKQLEPYVENYLQSVRDQLLEYELTSLVEDYICYRNIARFLSIKNQARIEERLIDLLEQICFQDVLTLDRQVNPAILFRLLTRLASSDEVNFQTLSRDFGKRESIEHFVDLLDKAEILNVFLSYGGVKVKTGANLKPFFMSPSLRVALYNRIYRGKQPAALHAKLYEDIVALSLRRIFHKGQLHFGTSEKGVSPDFIIETLDHPVALEVGTAKKTRKQLTKYAEQKRYGILVNSKITAPQVKDDCLFLPLQWFLLL